MTIGLVAVILFAGIILVFDLHVNLDLGAALARAWRWPRCSGSGSARSTACSSASSRPGRTSGRC